MEDMVCLDTTAAQHVELSRSTARHYLEWLEELGGQSSQFYPQPNVVRNEIPLMQTEQADLYRTMSIIYSHYVELNDIFVNNTGNTVSSCKSSLRATGYD